ncbi:myotubularin-like phosphatase domain-containing protein [Phthorimaea operculella]|nr:myotubularin-like phosphatase domain-containing protein [Phthorimaea operculella]
MVGVIVLPAQYAPNVIVGHAENPRGIHEAGHWMPLEELLNMLLQPDSGLCNKATGYNSTGLENVQMLDKYNLRNPSKGTLYFATTHLIFVDHEMRKETWILLMHISSVDRLPITTTGSPLMVRTKTFQSVLFVIPRERDCHEMHQTLLRLSQPVHIDELYCFHYKSSPDDLPRSAGWNFFDIQTEFQRMNVPNEQWVLCTANKDYEDNSASVRVWKIIRVSRIASKDYEVIIPVHIDELYCFHYKSSPDDLPRSAGWNFFDIQTEFQRMNVPNEQWVLCTANKDYEDYEVIIPVYIDELYCFHYKSSPDDLPRSAGWNFFDIQTEFQRMNVPNEQWVLCTANKDYEVYCFHYKSSPDDLPRSAGWNFFDIQTEFQRMNVPNEQWVLCTANKDYELCDTYPSEIYVPARATTAILLGSASFRSRGRLPALAYLHHNKAAIARCSQPLSGFSARCMEDEQMLDLIRRANPNCGYMYVVDTRPRINAMVNRAAGKGYENEAFYENIKFQFMGIGNIHVMRKSLQKLVETCEQNTPSMSSFLSGLESSGWLKHIKSILDTSVWIANAIESGVSVCVHCSDGWDRTAQVCSLAALCLEPHYRTINGYQALIEKDWLSFGHKFTCRCGHIACDGRERSPVFTQLLDCTWQLLRQKPSAFQFNESFLLTLHDHAHACQYGTFVGNCQKDRRDLRLSERTFSLWGYMANHLNEYKNPLYNPKAHPDVIKPDLSPQSIRFWRGMYCRHENGVHPRESLGDLLPAAVEHSSALEQHINYLTKRISTFKNLLSGKKADKSQDSTVVNYQNGNLDTVEIETKTESLQIDNKLLYECGGSLTELECANHDHPLKEAEHSANIPLITEKVDDTIPASILQLEAEVNTVALDWKSLKNVTECSCSTPLDHFSRKLEAEVNTVALDWKSLKNVTECSCSTPLDHFSRKLDAEVNTMALDWKSLKNVTECSCSTPLDHFSRKLEAEVNTVALDWKSLKNVTECSCSTPLDHFSRKGKLFLQLEAEVNTVALDWKSLKNVTECSCSTLLDHFSRKHHCWGCGRVVCTRCVSARAPLPALAMSRRAPLCAACAPSPPSTPRTPTHPATVRPDIISPAN